MPADFHGRNPGLVDFPDQRMDQMGAFRKTAVTEQMPGHGIYLEQFCRQHQSGYIVSELLLVLQEDEHLFVHRLSGVPAEFMNRDFPAAAVLKEETERTEGRVILLQIQFPEFQQTVPQQDIVMTKKKYMSFRMKGAEPTVKYFSMIFAGEVMFLPDPVEFFQFAVADYGNILFLLLGFIDGNEYLVEDILIPENGVPAFPPVIPTIVNRYQQRQFHIILPCHSARFSEWHLQDRFRSGRTVPAGFSLYREHIGPVTAPEPEFRGR